MLVFFPPRVRTSGGFPFYALISIQILGMINYSSERRKSRRTKKRRQSGQIRNESEKFTRGEVYFSPESTYTGYGSIISPIRENWTYPPHTNLFPDPTKMVRHIILPTPAICNRLQLWYTTKRTKGHS